MIIKLDIKGLVSEIKLPEKYENCSKKELENMIRDGVEKAITSLANKYAFILEDELGYLKVLDENTRIFLMDILNSRENHEIELLQKVFPKNISEAEAQFENFLRYKKENANLNIYQFIDELSENNVIN